ncbi:MAG: A24 family peptidase [Anaerolineaceae bacterium]
MDISILIAIVFGYIAALLVNYIADVLPVKRKLAMPECKSCQARILWVDYILNIPCKVCHQKRSFRTICVYLIYVLVAGALWLFPPAIGFWLGLLVVMFFGVVIVIDLEHRLVMHPVSIAGALIGLGIGIWQHGIVMTLIGGVAGFTIMLVLFYLGIGFVKLLSRKRDMADADEAIGFGDVTLSGVMGIFLGWPGIVAGLILMIVLGGIVSLFAMIFLLTGKKYHAYSAIPYAPFIALATIILLILAPRL